MFGAKLKRKQKLTPQIIVQFAEGIVKWFRSVVVVAQYSVPQIILKTQLEVSTYGPSSSSVYIRGHSADRAMRTSSGSPDHSNIAANHQT